MFPKESIETFSLVLVASGTPLPVHLPQPCTIRHLVTHYLDITCIPRRSFFELLSSFSPNDLEQEKLQEFSSAQGQEDLYAYCNRPRRTTLEVGRSQGSVESWLSLGVCDWGESFPKAMSFIFVANAPSSSFPGPLRLPTHNLCHSMQLSFRSHSKDQAPCLLHCLLNVGKEAEVLSMQKRGIHSYLLFSINFLCCFLLQINSLLS